MLARTRASLKSTQLQSTLTLNDECIPAPSHFYPGMSVIERGTSWQEPQVESHFGCRVSDILGKVLQTVRLFVRQNPSQ